MGLAMRIIVDQSHGGLRAGGVDRRTIGLAFSYTLIGIDLHGFP
jgi:hypothetical protein